MVTPGEYKAQLFKQIEGKFIAISDKVDVNINLLNQDLFENIGANKDNDFWKYLYSQKTRANDFSADIKDVKTTINLMLKSYEKATSLDEKLQSSILKLREKCLNIEQELNGSKVRSEIGEKNEYPTLWTYLWAASGSANSSYGPTKSHKKSLDIASVILSDLESKLNIIKSSINTYLKDLNKIGAPSVKETIR